MKRFKKITIILLAILPAIYTAITVFFFLPDTVAVHFRANGTPDRYGSKYEAFLLPGILLVMYIVYFLIRKFARFSSTDENNNTERNIGVVDTVILCVFIIFNVLCVMFLLLMKHPAMINNIESFIYPVIATVIGLLFVVIGNIMPKTKRNSMVGMRLSWCMDTDEHWYIANRAGGIAMVLSGFATIISGLALRSSYYIIGMLLSLFVSFTVATVYSYVIIKKKSSAE